MTRLYGTFDGLAGRARARSEKVFGNDILSLEDPT
jgi:hypothetical protein